MARLLPLAIFLPLTAASTAMAAPTTPPGPDAAAEATRRGIVQVEQAGRPLAVGTVLAKDGRVITALSSIASVENPEIRYADGTVVKARIGHRDKTWDLALLVPLTGRWLDGLVPTDADPSNVDLTAFLPKGGKLAKNPVGFKARVDARSREGNEALKSVLDLDMKGSPGIPGAAILDPQGKVVGILVRACKEAGETKPNTPAPACQPITIAAPTYALRGFLVKTPPAAALPAPWLGLGGATSDAGNVRGIKIMGIAPGSPAEKAGLKSGDAPDTIVAIDGQPVETPEQLAENIAKRAVGQAIKLLVYSGGKFREVPVTLTAAP